MTQHINTPRRLFASSAAVLALALAASAQPENPTGVETTGNTSTHPADRPTSAPLTWLPDCADAPMTLRLYWENDGAFQDPLDSYDRGYTNGIALTLDHQPLWAQQLLDYMPFADTFSQNHGRPNTAAGYILGQQFYTPRNIMATAALPGDRPYAGYLYGGVYWQRQADYQRRDDASVFDHFEINLGVVGDSSLAEDVQTWVHDNFLGDDPNGWDNQLRDEFAYQFYYRRKWRFDTGEYSLPLLGDVETQLIPQAGIALGSVHRYAEAALTARIGYRLPDDFGPGRLNDLRSATARHDPATAEQGWSWYAWLRVGGRYVEHNTFLDGSNHENPSPSIDKEPLVGEAQFGLAISYHDGPYTLGFTWGITYLTDEFDAPTGSNADDGTTSYGTMTFSLTKRF